MKNLAIGLVVVLALVGTVALYFTRPDLEPYVTRQELAGYAKVDHTHPAPDLSGYVTWDSLATILAGYQKVTPDTLKVVGVPTTAPPSALAPAVKKLMTPKELLLQQYRGKQ